MYRFLNICCPARNSVQRLTHYENVRWLRRPRKPFWLGVAPSKKFVVREPKKLPELENNELVRLQYIYDRQYESLRKFMSGTNLQKLFQEVGDAAIEEAFTLSLQKNEEWNAKSEALRIEREKREAEEMENRLLQEAEQEMLNEDIRKKKIDEIIDEEVELSQTFVTEENLDQYIDRCLENVVDYNYAIDLQGEIFKGGKIKPKNKHEPNQVKV